MSLQSSRSTYVDELARRRKQISVAFTAILFISIATFGSLVIVGRWWWDVREEVDIFTERTATLPRILQNAPPSRLDMLPPPPPEASRSGASVRDRRRPIARTNLLVRDASGTILFSNVVDPIPDEFFEGGAALPSGSAPSVTRVTVDGEQYLMKRFAFDSDAGALFAYAFERARATWGSLAQSLALLYVPLVALSLLAFYLIDRFVRATFRSVEEWFGDLETFVHNAGHELKTPLSVVSSSLQFLRATGDYDDRSVQLAERETQRMGELIDGLIRLSSIRGETPLEDASVAGLVEECLETFAPMAREKGVTVTRKVETDPVRPIAPEYARIIFANILKNAIRYERPGGTVGVAVTADSVTIRDTGCGISSEDLPHVFDRFYRGRTETEEGHGLGLALAKKAADALGWRISIESEVGRGTTVTVSL